jgi:hypothetical protein
VSVVTLPRLRRHHDEGFFVATEILEASSHARRAQILLRLPDALLLEKEAAVVEACQLSGFKMGLLFIGIRITALSAVRLPDGQLPEHTRATLALWHNGMTALAAGGQ